MSIKTKIIILLCLVGLSTVFAPLPSSNSHLKQQHHHHHKVVVVNKNKSKFQIKDDQFWKDGQPFRIIGGDLHYFRTLPQYWEDRLLRAKALGLNAIQTYVPWNLHEPKEGQLDFDEWDFGGFPAWLLTKEPALKLRSSDPAYLSLVDSWWGILLPKIDHLLYHKGGPIVMVQIENEFGSYGDDKDYMHHLVNLARSHLGDDIILYTTDGGTRDTLTKGTIRGETVFSAVDFSTGEDPWPIFKMQKEYNAPGKSPPLSSEFYTGWLTHWGETIAKTDATSTASALENILSRNGSAVLYMAHGGTNFGFYNGANAAQESDYTADLTSYDYDAPISESGDVDGAKFKETNYKFNMFCYFLQDAPISESGDVDGAKFKALRAVIAKYNAATLPPVPSNNEKTGYGRIKLEKTASLFDTLDNDLQTKAIGSDNPISMEGAGQMFGFLLYASEYTSKGNGNTLSIPKIMWVNSKEPAFYTGSFVVDKVTDTYMSFNGWGKGVAFVNDFNIGRYWPSFGPQCNLYVPAPILRRGKNVLVILELESPQPELVVHSVDQQDFTCGSKHLSMARL
nr:beta-galactosidase 17 [Tanacetum cinerariifolium]